MGVSTWARAFGEPLLEEVIVTVVANKDYKPSFWFLFLSFLTADQYYIKASTMACYLRVTMSML